MEKTFRIALTGGPGAGKTTAAALLRREIGQKIVIVPEAASLLFNGGFPRFQTEFAVSSTQKAIYHVQKNLENVHAAHYPRRVLLCDRGTLDSAVYWPKGEEDFYKVLDTSFEDESQRYDAVVFFETAAAGKLEIIEGGNPARKEGLDEALELDTKLKAVWSLHPNFHFIKHETSFMKKINNAHACILDLIKKFSE